MKKKAPIIIAVLILLAVAAYFAFRPHSTDVDSHIKNPDLGTRGGATQVDTETH